MSKKVIGVLGGMGPESTAEFYKEIIMQCQAQYGAKYDADYPEIFIYSLPVPDVVEEIEKNKTLAALISGAKKLESIGVDFIVVPCNTMHYFFDEIQKSVSIPMLSIIKETAKKVRLSGCFSACVLATQTTIKTGIYNTILNNFGIRVIVPAEQEKVTKIILNIMAGKKLESDLYALKKVVSQQKNLGAQAIIIGCTDLSVLMKSTDFGVKTFDSTKILAESTVKYAVKKN